MQARALKPLKNLTNDLNPLSRLPIEDSHYHNNHCHVQIAPIAPIGPDHQPVNRTVIYTFRILSMSPLKMLGLDILLLPFTHTQYTVRGTSGLAPHRDNDIASDLLSSGFHVSMMSGTPLCEKNIASGHDLRIYTIKPWL